MSGWSRVRFAVACSLVADLLVFLILGATTQLSGQPTVFLDLPLAAGALVFIVPSLVLFSPAVVLVRAYDTYKLVLVTVYGAAIGPMLMLFEDLRGQQVRRWADLLHLGIFFWCGTGISILAAVFYGLGMRRWNRERIQAN